MPAWPTSKRKNDWEKKRPELRRQFLEMLGLWPLPARTDLHPVVTGKVETDDFTVEKLHFQSCPACTSPPTCTSPRRRQSPAPTILYVCGHGNTSSTASSYGSKVHYQHHGAWFAEHGYVCLIVDTLQLGEIRASITAPISCGMWWWQTLGYTPAGIECWNAMRALDYLESRPGSGSEALGVTGRSGGGATSWWLAAADDRPSCIVPVAGIADLTGPRRARACRAVSKAASSRGHCDCMYFVNTYRWDFAEVVALCAPAAAAAGQQRRG